MLRESPFTTSDQETEQVYSYNLLRPHGAVTHKAKSKKNTYACANNRLDGHFQRNLYGLAGCPLDFPNKGFWCDVLRSDALAGSNQQKHTGLDHPL